jgi:Transglycosylase-like domain
MQMRNRLLLIAVPLCVVTLVAGVAAAAPNGGEHFKDTKLDDPHVVRPIAASASTEGPYGLDVIYTQIVIGAQAAQVIPQPPAPDPEPEPQPARWTPAPVAQAQSAGGGDFLSCVRNRESGGDYSVHNYGGSGAAGAYQFLPSTWNSTAAASGRSDLVGVDPGAASPADQDAMAQALYTQQGSSPWGGGC